MHGIQVNKLATQVKVTQSYEGKTEMIFLF